MQVNPHLFRAYDIRGEAGADLTVDVVHAIGRAYATYLAGTYDQHRIVAGRDARHSSESLFAAFVSGVRRSGTDVVDVGLSPSPLLYFAAAHWGIDGGANITASHNPPQMNGVKLLERGGLALAPEEIQELLRIVECEDFAIGSGGIEQRDPKPEYISFVGDRFRLPRALKVVADSGAGVAALTGPVTLRRMGCEVVELCSTLDGSFPCHPPDPQDLRNMDDLAEAVVRHGADLGVAWDGDGDRLGVVDERGQAHDADALLAVLARDTLSRLPGSTILVDVKTSLTAIRAIEAAGGLPRFGPTGHSIGKRLLRETGIPFGGEASAHFYFNEDYYGLDDGVFGACVVAHLVARSGRPCSDQFADLPHFETSPELRLPCPDERKFELALQVGEAFAARHDVVDVDGARIDFDGGWALVRASNTEPAVSVRLEAEDLGAFLAIRDKMLQMLERAGGVETRALREAQPQPRRDPLPASG